MQLTVVEYMLYFLQKNSAVINNFYPLCFRLKLYK